MIMKTEHKIKECFVIAPIGAEDSQTRKRSDRVLKFIINYALEKCGYKSTRADEISYPGIITSQILDKLLKAPLVIADLTEKNPNVFYELAIRHAARLPVIPIIDSSEPLPFDVAMLRTIQFDWEDLESVDQCKDAIIRQIHSIEMGQKQPYTLLQIALDNILRESRSSLVVAADKHYESAATLIRSAKKSVIICQRTSTILLGPERGRRAEEQFGRELYDALSRKIPVYHMFHEESCMADVWRMPSKFNTALGSSHQDDRTFPVFSKEGKSQLAAFR